MMFDLQLARLHSGGLEDAIREACDVAASEAGFEVLVDVASGRSDDDGVEERAYRTARDALVNAAKHSNAQTVSVTIVDDPTVLRERSPMTGVASTPPSQGIEIAIWASFTSV
jgi:signal transduction histidine kinase